MKVTKADEINDALVDTYRALLAINHAINHGDAADRPPTPGTGVSPAKVCKPSKRLRNWHRTHGRGLSLRAFARGIASWTIGGYNESDGRRVAQRWLLSKGARP